MIRSHCHLVIIIFPSECFFRNHRRQRCTALHLQKYICHDKIGVIWLHQPVKAQQVIMFRARRAMISRTLSSADAVSYVYHRYIAEYKEDSVVVVDGPSENPKSYVHTIERGGSGKLRNLCVFIASSMNLIAVRS